MASALKIETKSEFFKGKSEPVEAMVTDDGVELEEGELSDDEEVIAPLAEVDNPIFDSSEAEKAEKAKRFSLFGDTTLAVPKEELLELYESLGIDEETERHYRFNTVHLRGTDKMENEDIFDYFSGLEPARVDWLSKGACNVLWEDEILPARALLYLSVPIILSEKRHKRENPLRAINDSDSDDEMPPMGKAIEAAKLPFALPSGRWRKGHASDKSRKIIMRYANKDDKKLPAYMVAENPLYSDQYSHTRAKKAKHRPVHVEEPPKNPWGPLAQTWGRGEGVERIMYHSAPSREQPDLRSSLKDMEESRFAEIYLRRAVELHRQRPPSPPIFLESETSDESSDEDFMRRRKLPKMRADIEEEKIKRQRLETAARNNDLRSRITHKHAKISSAKPVAKIEISDESGDDLNWAQEGYSDLKMTLNNRRRERDDSLESDDSDLGLEEPGEMLQIEVDNEYCNKRRHRH